ncbi:MAG: ABC transporter permease [Bryobacterales bacterium]|nr:ABC transporter permease [Bryobacterales bacterium]
MRFQNWLYRLPLRLRSLFRRPDVDAELDQELAFHLERQIEANVAAGATPAEARTAALRAIGNTTLLKEEARESWGWRRWDAVRNDARQAARQLRKSPGFAFTAIATLALAIGATTAMFTIVDSVVLRPLSYRDSGQLVTIWERLGGLDAGSVGPNPRHFEFFQQVESFSGAALVQQGARGLSLAGDHPQFVGTVWSSPNLFTILQVKPQLGRAFRPENGKDGNHNVAILTHGLWQKSFGGDPNVIGKQIRLGDVPREVIGVLPPDFHFPNRNALRPFESRQTISGVPEPAVFLPAVIVASQYGWQGDYGNWVAIGRLRPGVTVDGARSALAATMPRIVEAMPAGHRPDRPEHLQADVQPMQEAIVGKSKSSLWFLMAAVLGLLLIACVNLASAQLARTLARRREASLRTALGAPKWRLVEGALVENLVLSAVGGAAGLAVAYGALQLFRHYAPVDLPRLTEVRLNTSVLAFSAAVTLCTSLLFSILPGLHLLRAEPQAALQQTSSARSVGGSSATRRLHRWLIGAQVCGGTALLLVTAVFAHHLWSLLRQEKGFHTNNAAFAQVPLSGPAYESKQARTTFIDGVLANIRRLPGVEAAGYVSVMPLTGESWIDSLRRPDRPEQRPPLINLRWASPGYFEAMGHRLVAGRFFEERDRELNSVILSEGEARALWDAGQDSIGGMVRLQGGQFKVVGVVADSRTASLKTPPARFAWLHHSHRPSTSLFFIVRGSQPPGELPAAIRQAIWSYAPDATIAIAKTLDTQVRESLGAERFQAAALAAFAAAALLMAMLGIHGVLSYAVAARRQEFGVRRALGATPSAIYAAAFRETVAPVAAGLAAGLGWYVAMASVIGKMTEVTRPLEPLAVVLVVLLFLGAALVAGWLPARRAANADPLEALRAD